MLPRAKSFLSLSQSALKYNNTNSKIFLSTSAPARNEYKAGRHSRI